MKMKTVRKHKDFIGKPQDIKMRSVCFIVRIKDRSIPTETRYGIIASKRTFKKAVERARAKRVIRDWIAFNEDLFTLEKDYIFILNREILDYNREIGRKDTAKALKRIKKAWIETSQK